MEAALRGLIRISKRTGADARLVQGGGGNSSVKSADGKYMYIKASGTALKDMSAERGWRRLRLDQVRVILNDPALLRMEAAARDRLIVSRLLAACEDGMPGASRPSVEAHLHAILDRYVIHLHPSVVSAYVNGVKGEAEIRKLFPDDPPLWVPYTDPGLLLARRMAGLVERHVRLHGKAPAVAFLEKHGLFVSAGSEGAALRLVSQVIARLERGLKAPRGKQKPASSARRAAADDLRSAALAIRRALFETTGRYRVVQHRPSRPAEEFMALPDAKKLLAAGPLSPDELVYSGGAPLWLASIDATKLSRILRRQREAGRKPSAAFLAPGLGLFTAGDARVVGTIREVAESSLYARGRAVGGFRALSAREAGYIAGWESENYRMQLAGEKAGGALAERIAIVSGAGSGLGRGIALGLARAGALVALADVDRAAAAETASLIRTELPAAAVLAVPCDVTDERGVEQAFDAVVDEWGGLDILVNAAGVAPAYSLTELPVDKWRLALEVNLTGYFLMARQAARLMQRQGMGGSIVNLSSKSGLEASRNNTAYNATKAGELHMARGWAMELGGDGIRVNCVCPGNVFEGSRIWNPAYIRAAAKKYGIKPEEVIPHYVNKTILRRDIKGQDIADSVVFLCSDKARTITGQIIVADSGQVMVR